MTGKGGWEEGILPLRVRMTGKGGFGMTGKGGWEEGILPLRVRMTGKGFRMTGKGLILERIGERGTANTILYPTSFCKNEWGRYALK